MSFVVCSSRLSDTYFLRFFRKESVAQKYRDKMNKRFGCSMYHILDNADYFAQVDKWLSNPFTVAMLEHANKEHGLQ